MNAMEALRLGNQTRMARVELRRQVAEGERRLSDLLADPPREIMSAPIGKLLTWPRRRGARQAAVLLAGVPFPPDPTVPLRRLSAARRMVLAGRVRERWGA